MDLIFSRKYKEEDTLVYFEEGVAVASLQLQPYTMQLYGEAVQLYYLMGLCTLPEYRGRGYMAQLIVESIKVVKLRGVFLTVLVPAENWLYGYYAKYGYVKTFDEDPTPIDLELIAHTYSRDVLEAYKLFDMKFQHKESTVLKTQDDFDVMLTEYTMDNLPRKSNLGGMSHFVNPLPVLRAYAKANPHFDFTFSLAHSALDKSANYHVHRGVVDVVSTTHVDFEINIQQLTSLLLGYNVDQFPAHIGGYFEPKHPSLNLMLE
jgi:predicted acetyltransferase